VFAATIAIVLVAALVIAIVIAGWNTSSSNNEPVDGAVIFRQRCSGCHGVTGGGGTGPQLSNGAVVQKYPNIEDEIAIVTNGRDGMPAWKNALSKEQIRAVVDYTRTQL